MYMAGCRRAYRHRSTYGQHNADASGTCVVVIGRAWEVAALGNGGWARNGELR